ncbi:lymphocyte-specific protein 1-like [Macaca mulatta]
MGELRAPRWRLGPVTLHLASLQLVAATETAQLKCPCGPWVVLDSVLWFWPLLAQTQLLQQSTPSEKRYTFVATRHGKNEKVFVEGDLAP